MFTRSLVSLALICLLIGAHFLLEPGALADPGKAIFPCVSRFNGHHSGFNREIMRQLNDPNSFEPYKTDTFLTDFYHAPGLWKKELLTVDFSARNSFGGRVRQTALGLLDPANCQVRLVTLDYKGNLGATLRSAGLIM